MDSIHQLSDSLATLIWPLLIVVLAWRLYPTIQKVISSRAFTVKVGAFEFTAQEATEKLVKSTAELQGRIAALDQQTLAAPTETDGVESTGQDRGEARRPAAALNFRPRKFLWVDDVPDRHAYEIVQLESLGVDVVLARSTTAALESLGAGGFDAVVTGMGRSEGGTYAPRAGQTLVEAVRDSSDATPVYVFAANLAPQVRAEVEESGGLVVTTSMQLFDALWSNQSASPIPN